MGEGNPVKCRHPGACESGLQRFLAIPDENFSSSRFSCHGVCVFDHCLGVLPVLSRYRNATASEIDAEEGYCQESTD